VTPSSTTSAASLVSSTSLKLPSTRATTVTMNGNYNGTLAVLHGIGLGSSRILRKGGLLATSSIGLGYGLTPWALACLKTPKPATTYTREQGRIQTGLERTASASSALAFSFLSSSSLLCNSLNLENPWLQTYLLSN
jgi:hypothetical protein